MQKLFSKQATSETGLDEFSLTENESDTSVPHEPLTFWIPTEYKSKYDQIQSRSRRRFGKHLKEILKRAIDKIELEDAG